MDKARQLLKAQALGDLETADAVSASLTDDEREHYYVLALALFAGVVEQRLGDGPSRDDIVAFVDQMRQDYREAYPGINPLHVEAMIRAVFGEDHLLDDISAGDQYLAQLPVVRKIVAQSSEVAQQIDAYLDDAGTLAAQWND